MIRGCAEGGEEGRGREGEGEEGDGPIMREMIARLRLAHLRARARGKMLLAHDTLLARIACAEYLSKRTWLDTPRYVQ